MVQENGFPRRLQTLREKRRLSRRTLAELWFVWLTILGCQPTIFSAEKIFQVNTHGVTEAQKLCYGFIGPMYEIHRMPPF